MIIVKNCKNDDLESIRKLYSVVNAENKFVPQFTSKERFEEMIKRDDILLDKSLIAIDDESETQTGGVVIAYLLVSIREKHARISSLGVLKDKEDTGIVERLLNIIISNLREIEQIYKITTEIIENDEKMIKVLEDYNFVNARTLHTYFKDCTEKVLYKSNFKIQTDFPSDLLKNYHAFHIVNQPWLRTFETLSHYNKKIVGYGIYLNKKIVGYTLVGFDNTIMDFAILNTLREAKELSFSLLYHVFQKFDYLVTIDLPTEDELFEIYEKSGFHVIYKKYDMQLVFHNT